MQVIIRTIPKKEAEREWVLAGVVDGKVTGAPNEFEDLDRKLYLRLYEKFGGSKKMGTSGITITETTST